MDLTERLEADLKFVREALFRLLRVGVVDSTQPERGTVRVRFSDQEGLITWECQVLFAKTHKDKAYWMPDIGDQVAVLCLPYGSSQGFVLGAMYSDKDAPPVASQDKRHVLFKDGTWLEYDRKSHTWSGHIKGQVDQLTIDKSAVIEVGESVQATIGQNLTAEVGNAAEVSAGAHITLNAPLINLQGNLSSAGQGGGTATETKTADTDHTGSYTLNGDLQVNGSINATGSIIDGGGNTNHHTH